MTDNTVIVAETGSEAVQCHRGDGWGIARLQEAGLPMLVLSTERNLVVKARCAKRQLPCQQGVGDKAAFLENYLREHQISPTNVVYVGNDVNDFACLRLVGYPVAVADSHPSVLSTARLVLAQRGGHGAVRERCDRILAPLAERQPSAREV